MIGSYHFGPIATRALQQRTRLCRDPGVGVVVEMRTRGRIHGGGFHHAVLNRLEQRANAVVSGRSCARRRAGDPADHNRATDPESSLRQRDHRTPPVNRPPLLPLPAQDASRDSPQDRPDLPKLSAAQRPSAGPACSAAARALIASFCRPTQISAPARNSATLPKPRAPQLRCPNRGAAQSAWSAPGTCRFRALTNFNPRVRPVQSFIRLS